MSQDQSQYVLLKLKNGDEIIAKKSGVKKGALLLSRPLQINRSTFLDPITGSIKKNICIFRDWLEFATDIEWEIAVESIILNVIPTPEMVERYLIELDKLDNPNKYTEPKTKIQKQSKAETEDLLDQYFKAFMPPQAFNPAQNTNNQRPVEPPTQPPLSSSMVTATFSIPPDVFLNIVLNMPMFDGWGGSGDESSDDGEDDTDSEGDKPPSPPPKNKASNKKKKPKQDDDTPPSGEWHGRFGFPK